MLAGRLEKMGKMASRKILDLRRQVILACLLVPCLVVVPVAFAAEWLGTSGRPIGGVTPPGVDPSDPEVLVRGIIKKPPVDEQPAPADPTAKIVIKEGVRIDRREMIAAGAIGQPPFSAIGLIVSRYANGVEEQGTGFLVEPGIVLTAGHVLHSHRHGPAIVTSFLPGCALAAKLRGQTVDANRYRVGADWKRGNDGLASDYGAIFLPDRQIYAGCGIFSLSNVTAGFIDRYVTGNSSGFMIAGFPAEKPPPTMWFEAGVITPSAAGSVEHTIDTTPGQSGAPLFAALIDPRSKRRVPMVIGIHSRPAPSGETNQARRIDAQVLQDLRSWALDLLPPR
jgi:V8-like Glu-specific endopeptidase